MSSTQQLLEIYNMYFTSSQQELVEIHNHQKSEKFFFLMLLTATVALYCIMLPTVTYMLYIIQIPTNPENTTYNNFMACFQLGFMASFNASSNIRCRISDILYTEQCWIICAVVCFITFLSEITALWGKSFNLSLSSQDKSFNSHSLCDKIKIINKPQEALPFYTRWSKLC